MSYTWSIDNIDSPMLRIHLSGESITGWWRLTRHTHNVTAWGGSMVVRRIRKWTLDSEQHTALPVAIARRDHLDVYLIHDQ